MRRTVRLAMLGILLVGVLGLSQGTTEALEAKLDTLDATLHGLHFFTDPSGKEIQWFPYISDQVKSLSEDLDLFEIKVIADLADLELAADAIEGKLDTLEGKADNLATQLSAHDSDMKAQFDQVDAALASLEGKLDDETRFTDDTELGDAQTAIIAEIDANEGKLDSLSTAVAAVEGKLDTIIGWGYDIPGRFDALDDAVAAVEGKADDLGAKEVVGESLDIFRLQQDIAHRNGLKCTIQMTYAALYNDEAIALATSNLPVASLIATTISISSYIRATVSALISTPVRPGML